MTKTMLILRGIAGSFDGHNYPNGALDERSASAYAILRGYLPHVLTVSGEAYDNSPQVQYALKEFRQDQTITALYGFSGGGYNLKHVLKHLNNSEMARLNLVVVLGAPKNPTSYYKGPWELVYRNDPPEAAGGHMAAPARLVEEFKSGKLYPDWQAKYP